MKSDLTYTRTAKTFHWTLALLVILMLAAGLVMVRDVPEGLGDVLFAFHKNMGLIVLVLMLVRLVYRLFHPAPPLPPFVPRWQAGIAVLTHWLLYATVIVMGTSGYIRVTAGGYPLELADALGLPRVAKNEALGDRAEAIHAATHYVLIALVLLHVAAALRHALRRDGVFRRML